MRGRCTLPKSLHATNGLKVSILLDNFGSLNTDWTGQMVPLAQLGH